MAVGITRTADPTGVSASGNVATYTNVDIGNAHPDRIVVVCVTSELSAASINSCTLGGVSMNAGTQGTFGVVYARTFYLKYPTETTATVAVTFGANPNNTQNHISVYNISDASYSSTGGNGSTDMDATALTTGAITIATGGGFIAVAGGATATTTAKTWANATEDLEVNAGSHTHTTATRTTALSATAITCTGGNNGEDGALSYLIFTDLTPSSSISPSLSPSSSVSPSLSPTSSLSPSASVSPSPSPSSSVSPSPSTGSASLSPSSSISPSISPSGPLWDVTDAQVGHWLMNDNLANTTVLDSEGNYNGVLNENTDLHDSVGKINGALDFTDDRVAIGDMTAVLSTVYSISLWFNPDALTGGNVDQQTYGYTLVASSVSSPVGYAVWITVRGTEIRIATFEATAGVFHDTSGANLVVGNWYHLVVNATKGGNTEVFLNGISILSYTNDGYDANWRNIFTIGDLRPGRAIYFDGLIDDVRLFDRALTEHEIRAIYNDGDGTEASSGSFNSVSSSLSPSSSVSPSASISPSPSPSAPEDNDYILKKVIINTPVIVSQGGTGLASITDKGVLVGAGISNVAAVSPGTLGNVLKSDGTNWISGQIDLVTSGSVTYQKLAGDLVDIVAVSGTDIDWSLGAIYTKTLTTNTTFTFSNYQLDKIIILKITGQYALGFPTNVKIIAGEYDGTVMNYITLHCTNSTSGSEEVWGVINQRALSDYDNNSQSPSISPSVSPSPSA